MRRLGLHQPLDNLDHFRLEASRVGEDDVCAAHPLLVTHHEVLLFKYKLRAILALRSPLTSPRTRLVTGSQFERFFVQAVE